MLIWSMPLDSIVVQIYISINVIKFANYEQRSANNY